MRDADFTLAEPSERRMLARSDATISKLNPRRISMRPPAGRLSIVFPRALAISFDVDGGPFVLGRRGDGQVRHPTVSRAHAAIAWSAGHADGSGAYVVRDLDSRNGSALDGAPLRSQPRPLCDGSVLRLGDVVAVWECSTSLGARDCADVSEAIPGRAAAMQALRSAIARAAGDRAPVLILGETGSGKERVARELHRRSGRSGPLVAINCAALQPSLVESELFGHVRGAFTGAHEAQRGLFREADGGSLFLDEIGELPTALQAKLLRVIQEHEVQPVGGADPVSIDVRVLAATHREPTDAIAAGILREDLYARLSLWELHVPPLRARRVDLPDWLVRLHAAWQHGGGSHRALPPLSVDAMEALLLQHWSLNLRAVERLVRELAARSTDHVIEPRDLPGWLDAAAGAPAPSAAPAAPAVPCAPGAHAAPGAPTAHAARVAHAAHAATPPLEPRRPPLPSRDEFVTAFEQLGGSVRALARHFGRERRQIYRWIEAHGVRASP
jgi:DNA-binding NtrC family response regulator